MGSHDVRDEMAHGFGLADPPSGHEGPLRSPRPPPPRLCEQGPCRHYHRFEIQVDAEDPRPVRVPDSVPRGTRGVQETPQGLIYQPPPAFHREVHHYCYPHPGVDTNLGSLPVLACNRWYPKAETQEIDEARAAGRFSKSEAGERYERELADWQAERDADLAAEQTIDRLTNEQADRLIALGRTKETP